MKQERNIDLGVIVPPLVLGPVVVAVGFAAGCGGTVLLFGGLHGDKILAGLVYGAWLGYLLGLSGLGGLVLAAAVRKTSSGSIACGVALGFVLLGLYIVIAWESALGWALAGFAPIAWPVAYAAAKAIRRGSCAGR